jgi:hypothetical protein
LELELGGVGWLGGHVDFACFLTVYIRGRGKAGFMEERKECSWGGKKGAVGRKEGCSWGTGELMGEKRGLIGERELRDGWLYSRSTKFIVIVVEVDKARVIKLYHLHHQRHAGRSCFLYVVIRSISVLHLSLCSHSLFNHHPCLACC